MIQSSFAERNLRIVFPLPAIAFGAWHWKRAHHHPNRRAVRMGNVTGFQFHPEKSGPAGLALLTRFIGVTAAASGGPST